MSVHEQELEWGCKFDNDGWHCRKTVKKRTPRFTITPVRKFHRPRSMVFQCASSLDEPTVLSLR